MSDLTPAEKRAVEKACAWDRNVRATVTPSEQRLVNGVKAQMVGRDVEAQMVVGGCAIGYLAGDRDGYRRGVEAAMTLAEDDYPTPLTKSEWDAAGGSAARARANRIRALLAQEEERG